MKAEQYQRVRLNVGGEIFETTTKTLSNAAPESLLHRSSSLLRGASAEEFFIDRDPKLFAHVLGALRDANIAAHWEKLTPQTKELLIAEAAHFGAVDALQRSVRPRRLRGFDAERVGMLAINGRDYPSSLASAADGSLWLGHGGKITAFDWALRRCATALTRLSSVDLLLRLGDHVAAVGSPTYPGLHVYDLQHGCHVSSFFWSDPNDPRVYRPYLQGIAASDDTLYASFENGQRMENAVVALDRQSMTAKGEFNRQSGASSQSKVPNILEYVPSRRMLLVAASHGGTFGYTGYIRLFDPRTDAVIWEWIEPHQRLSYGATDRDCFADLTVSEDLGSLIKVSVMNGALAMADLRRLDSANPWITLQETNPAMAVKEGSDYLKLLAYGREIFCSRGDDLEVWSEVRLAEPSEISETSFRRNFIEHSRRHGTRRITSTATGGDRLFVSRSDVQGVEVWETRSRPFPDI